MDYAIKQLSINDLTSVVDIVNRVLQDDFPEYPKRVSDIYRKHIYNKKFFRKLIKNKDNVVLGAVINQRLAGVIVIKIEFGGVAYIEWLAVKKEYRNKGLGSSLLKQAEKWALNNFYHYLYLFTESKKNMEYYKQRGFNYLGCHRKSYFGADEHVFQKILKDKPFEEMFNKFKK